MNKKFRIATIAGAVSIGLLTAGQANAAAPDCNTPKQITIKDAQAAQNINVDELVKKYNAQPQKAEAAAPAKKEAQPKAEAAQPAQQAEAKPAESKDSKAEAKDVSEFEQQVVTLVNEERAKEGLKPLELDTELSDVAREKSKDMMDKGYFDHTSPTYGSPFDMMKQFGIEYSSAGENIAKGQKTPEEVMEGWMNSDGHRKNIMNPDFTHIGVGFVEGDSTYWTQMFISK